MKGLITVVGGTKDDFHFMGENKLIFLREEDPDNFYYNEMCGHKFNLKSYPALIDYKYIGLEHYRRAFDYTDDFIDEVLSVYDIIVKQEHGPYGDHTNLSILKVCSRHGLDYLAQATEWVERFPELKQQAELKTHFGCNMFITRPERYREMMEDEFNYIDEIMKTPNLQQSIVSYFCETILTPFIIKKYNKNIAIGRVKTCL